MNAKNHRLIFIALAVQFCALQAFSQAYFFYCYAIVVFGFLFVRSDAFGRKRTGMIKALIVNK